MASTYSPSLRLELIGTGDQSGLWGDTTNTNLGSLIEQAITGVESIPMLDLDYTLSALNGSPDEARNAVIIMTSVGPLTASRNIIIPADEKVYIVKNSTTGGQNLVVKTSGGSGYTVPNGKTAFIYCDGIDCHTAVNYIDTPTFNNAVLTGTPTAPTAAYGTNTPQLATTAFVQSALQALYPVGSVYINASATTNPATLFGFGTWTEIGAGRVLVGQNTSDAIFDALGETGGSKDAIAVSHTHGLTAASTTSAGAHIHTISDPGHSHSFRVGGGSSGPRDAVSVDTYNEYAYGTSGSGTGISINSAGAHTHTLSGNTDSTGSSGTNANLPPYIVVKMWQRTA